MKFRSLCIAAMVLVFGTTASATAFANQTSTPAARFSTAGCPASSQASGSSDVLSQAIRNLQAKAQAKTTCPSSSAGKTVSTPAKAAAESTKAAGCGDSEVCKAGTCNSGNVCVSGACPGSAGCGTISCGNTAAGNQSFADLIRSLLEQCGWNAKNPVSCPSSSAPSSSAPSSSVPAASEPSSSAPSSSVPASSAPASSAPSSSAPSASQPSSSVQAYEEQVAQLVNTERQKNGLKPLTLSAKLSNVARVKSQDMHDKNYFSHTSPTYGSPFDMMKSFGITYRAAGENIAMGYRSPEAVMNGWMNSSGHRANILNANYTQIGVGYVADGNYWTQEFIG